MIMEVLELYVFCTGKSIQPEPTVPNLEAAAVLARLIPNVHRAKNFIA